MDILKINDGIIEHEISYNMKFTDNIFIAHDKEIAIKNCELLNIITDSPENEDYLVETISKIGDIGILTLTGTKDCHQYIFTMGAKEEDLEVLLEAVDPAGHPAFWMAFGVARPIFLDSFGQLAEGGAVYYIPDASGDAMPVSEEQHAEWNENKSTDYNKVWDRPDGTKQLSLSFYGKEDEFGDINLFQVRNIFRDFEGTIVTDIIEGFSSYQEALEHYEYNVNEALE